jgi:hypothetical protein
LALQARNVTIQAFDYYMKITEEDREARLRRSAMFLWIDRQPEAHRRSLYERLKRGDIVIERLETTTVPSECLTESFTIMLRSFLFPEPRCRNQWR